MTATPDPQSLRDRFRAHVGDERYAKFVRAVNRDGQRLGRLLFWQERTWAEFAEGDGGLALSPDAILAVFFCCEIHPGELRRVN